jgi:hypothetical protein
MDGPFSRHHGDDLELEEDGDLYSVSAIQFFMLIKKVTSSVSAS